MPDGMLMGIAWLLVAAAAMAVYRASPRQAWSNRPTPRWLMPAAMLAFVVASALMGSVHGTLPGIMLAFCGLMMALITAPSLLAWRQGDRVARNHEREEAADG